jgi:hypothetical protein
MRSTRIGLALAAALLVSEPAFAQCFNVDLGTFHGSPSASYGGAAGQPGVWNELPVVKGALYPLVDLGGSTTKARFVLKYLPYGGPGIATGGPTGEDEQLLNDFVNDVAIIAHFERLEPGQYLVYTYGWAPKATGYQENMVLVSIKNGKHVNDRCGDEDWTGAHVPHESYLTDLVTVDATGRIRIIVCNYSPGAGRLSGFQLVKIGSCPSAGTPYCDQGKVEGCDSETRVSGRPNASLGDRFQVEVVGTKVVRDGFLFFSTNGRQSVPWQGTGNQCVVPPVQRTDLLTSGTGFSLNSCDGQLSFDFNGWMAAHPAKAPPPGSTVQMQAVTYPPASPSSLKLLDAIEFTIEP